MKKPKSSHIEHMINQYQERLDMIESNQRHDNFLITMLVNEVNDMKQALDLREQKLDSWRDLLADMQIEIGEMRAGTSAGTSAGTPSRMPDPVTPEPSNGFGWWRRIFATEPAPTRTTLEDPLHRELLRILSQEPSLRNLLR